MNKIYRLSHTIGYVVGFLVPARLAVPVFNWAQRTAALLELKRDILIHDNPDLRKEDS